MSAERMPQPPPGWKPKRPISTVPRGPDVLGVNDNSVAMNLSDNTRRLDELEESGFIDDWGYESTARGYVYYITLVNGDEIAVKGGHIPIFYIGAYSAMSVYEDNYDPMPLDEIDLYLVEEEEEA